MFSGVCAEGHRWFPLSNVADHETVYVRPTRRDLSRGIARTTLPVSAPETVWVGTREEATVALRVTWPELSPGSEDSEASSCTWR